MSKKMELLPVSLLEELNTAGAGYDVLRYISLPEILGDQSDTLLYFMGKNLARKMEINTIEDIVYIFDKLGWGRLELIKEKKKELFFHLMADSVAERLQASFDEFRMEAGFLAEALQLINETECECVEEINYKIHQVELRVVFTSIN